MFRLGMLHCSKNHVFVLLILGIPSSWSSSAEGKPASCFLKKIHRRGFFFLIALIVEKSTKYYLMRNLLLSIFELLDSDDIPPNPKKATSYLQGSSSSGNYLARPRSPSAGDRTSTGSSLSATSRRDWVRRLASYSSVAPSSHSGSHNIDTNNEITELIVKSLQKCGEDIELLPIFKAAFPSLTDVHENKYTVRLDGRARDILLTGVITRIIRYTSEHVRLVFICDDVQCKYSYLPDGRYILCPND